MKRPDPQDFSSYALSSGTGPLSEQEEFVLIREIVAGQRDRFRYFVERYQRPVLNLLFRQIGNSSTAEDLAQEVFLRAFSALPKFRFEASFSTWIIRIALNHCRTYFAQQRAQQVELSEQRLESAGAAELRLVRSPELQLEQLQRLACFRVALMGLPEYYRETFVLVALEGKDYEEVAKILRIPIGTVRSRLNKSRTLLREALAKL